MLGSSLAAVAGLFASLASVCAKLAMAEESTLTLCEGAAQIFPWFPDCNLIVVYVRVCFFALIFGCNALMWTFFVKSLQKCSSSIEATITNTSANLIFTAIFGKLLFGEVLSLAWCFGAALVVFGLALVHTDSKKDDKEKVS